jgi:hypothetical protein
VDGNRESIPILSIDERARCEGRRVIAHVSRLCGTEGGFTKIGFSMRVVSGGGSDRLHAHLCGLGL